MAENKGIDFDLTFPKISKLPYLGSKRRARHDLLADLAVDMVGLQLDLDVKVEIVPLLAPLEMDQLWLDEERRDRLGGRHEGDEAGVAGQVVPSGGGHRGEDRLEGGPVAC